MNLALEIGTLVDDPSALPEPRPPLMKRMCGRCQLVLGWKVCIPEVAGTVTHGLCDGCSAVVLEELDEMPTPESAADVARWREHRAALALATEYTIGPAAGNELTDTKA